MSDIRTIRPSESFPFSHAVVHNGVVYVSGQVGFSPGTTQLVSDDLTEQTEQVFRNVDDLLVEAGTSRDRILRCGVYLKQVERDFKAFNHAYARWLGDHRPARSAIQASLAIPEILVELDCVAAMPV